MFCLCCFYFVVPTFSGLRCFGGVVYDAVV